MKIGTQEKIELIDAKITLAAGEQVRLNWRIAALNAQVQRHANKILKLNRERSLLVEELKP